jgi:hypothetical protein
MKNLPQRNISFLVVWLTMFSCVFARGQNTSGTDKKSDFLHLNLPGTKMQQVTHNTDYIGGPDTGIEVLFAGHQNTISNAAYSAKIDITNSPQPVFCKMEWEMEKAIHVPLRFRLGSLADCNMLEGKH